MNESLMIVCPKCGAKSTELDFIGAFCVNCYEFKIETPKEIVYKQCTRCERIWLEGEWKQSNKKKIEENIISKFRGNFEKIDYYLDSETAVAYFNVDGKIHMVDTKFAPVFEKTICRDCSKKSGGYFEAIVQLRGNRKRVEKYANRLNHIFNKKTFITKVEEQKEGIDFYIGSAKAVFEIMKTLGLRYNISRKLFTRIKGKRIYRTTFSIRF